MLSIERAVVAATLFAAALRRRAPDDHDAPAVAEPADTTYQHWDFHTGPAGFSPDGAFQGGANPNGLPQLVPSNPANWLATFGGRATYLGRQRLRPAPVPHPKRQHAQEGDLAAGDVPLDASAGLRDQHHQPVATSHRGALSVTRRARRLDARADPLVAERLPDRRDITSLRRRFPAR